jgi:hypothetical protein
VLHPEATVTPPRHRQQLVRLPSLEQLMRRALVLRRSSNRNAKWSLIACIS